MLVGIGPMFGLQVWHPHIGVLLLDSMLTNPYCAWNGFIAASPEICTITPVTLSISSGQTEIQKTISLGISLFDWRDNVCVDFIGGIEEHSGDKMHIFPLLSDGVFTINTRDGLTCHLTILSSNGAIIKSIPVQDQEQVDLGFAANGVYYYSMNDLDGRFSSGGKLIVLH